MPKVICTLPNASELINNVKFVSHAKGMISEDVDQEVADAFVAIEGYEVAIVAAPVGKAPVAKGKSAAVKPATKEVAPVVEDAPDTNPVAEDVPAADTKE